MRKPIRAVAIVIKDGKILLMFRKKGDRKYYVLPGGGVEGGESIKTAVLRELYEETTIKAKIDKLLYQHLYDERSEQFFYLCKFVSGRAKLGPGIEKERLDNRLEVYKPEWIEINKLSDILLYPLEIRDWIIEDFKNNFKNTPRKATLKVKDLRQEL